ERRGRRLGVAKSDASREKLPEHFFPSARQVFLIGEPIDQSTSPLKRFTSGLARSASKPAVPTNHATLRNRVAGERSCMRPATRPAIKFPSAAEMNHAPIICP